MQAEYSHKHLCMQCSVFILKDKKVVNKFDKNYECNGDFFKKIIVC